MPHATLLSQSNHPYEQSTEVQLTTGPETGYICRNILALLLVKVVETMSQPRAKLP